MALTNEQLILLDNLIYLNDSVIGNNLTVDNVVSSLLGKSDEDFETAVTDKQFFYCGDMVNGMTTNQWKNVLNAISKNSFAQKVNRTSRYNLKRKRAFDMIS